MNSSRYMLVDERFQYPVKRRPRGPRDGKGHEPAITLLPPDPYLIMERPAFARSPSPTVYRTAPPKSARNKEASSFVILGDVVRSPVQSRPGSPSGRVSPFRGRGFKSPGGTRPSSTAASPCASPRKRPPRASDRPRIGRDIGLPPKSPMKRPQKVEAKPQDVEAKQQDAEAKQQDVEAEPPPPEESETGDETTEAAPPAETEETVPEEESNDAPTIEPPKVEETTEVRERPKLPRPPRRTPTTKQRLTPAPRDKKPPVSPIPRTKTKPEKKDTGQHSVIKKTTKPPVPPKKVGMKTTLKTGENVTDQSKKSAKDGKSKVGESRKKEESEGVKPATKPPEEEVQVEVKEEPKVEEQKQEEEAKEAEVRESEEKKEEKLVPCFQPDKCQIAPPTMASPSPIVTPTMSTPSTTADLASGSVKNSQSIAAAPTTVTPSSLSSVSSTVVLTGNLARKEIEARSRPKEADAPVALVQEAAPPPEPAAEQMVKAAADDSVKWPDRDAPSGEITSATKVIKGEPEMEVLSPNSLRDSPPRVPPPNVAWDEGRMANGDVPNKTESEGKCRRFLAAIWRFLSYVFCCRCFPASKCCRRSTQEGAPPKPSIFSRLKCRGGNCCGGKCCDGKCRGGKCCDGKCRGGNCFRNPFECCIPCCRSPKCEGKKCCRRNSKPGDEKPKPPRKCCAKAECCKGCCDRMKARCANLRAKTNSICRSLFCLNMMCCQNFLRKFRCCHRLKCCQKDGFCSCCNPNVKKEGKKLNKKGSRASNNSKDKDNLDLVLVEHTSLMKAAIPVLPSCLAVFCLILNLFVPGLGTFISGLLCLCFGKPRFSVKDTPKNRVGSFIVNTVIGIAQLFTIVFCLVGWGWSIWWGVIMYKLSRRQKRLKLAEKNQKEAEGSNVNHNHVDVEQG